MEQDHQFWNIDGMSEYDALDDQEMAWLETFPLGADLLNNYPDVNPFTDKTFTL